MINYGDFRIKSLLILILGGIGLYFIYIKYYFYFVIRICIYIIKLLFVNRSEKIEMIIVFDIFFVFLKL